MRLPRFLTELSPVGETLAALEQEQALLAEETAARNRQLAVSTADESLSLWEQDYSLPQDPKGSLPLRRSRVRTAMTGGCTLTREALEALAVSVGGADRGEVTEDFAGYAVTLTLVGDGWMPACSAALKEAVERLKPAHLTVALETRMELSAQTLRYPVWSGGVLVETESRDSL